jgi:hypothetical protein
MNTNRLGLQGVKGTELLPKKRYLMAASSIRSFPTPGGRYVCRASLRSGDGGDAVPKARCRTVEVVSIEENEIFQDMLLKLIYLLLA